MNNYAVKQNSTIMKNLILFLFIGILFAACSTPNIVVDESLKNNTSVMEAKGRQGWQINQVIKYGDYTTSKVKRGWTSVREINFIARFRKAKQKLSFMQNTPDGLQADVLAVSSFEATEISLLNGFLTYAPQYEDVFAGTILTEEKEWEFIIHNPEGSLPQDADCGVIRDTKGNEILIRGVKKVEGQANWVQLDNFGFEFIRNGQSIGAVSTINNGRVWMKDNLRPELKLVLSSISSSLLLRHSMQESFDN